MLCTSNQWTCFCMIGTTIMKELTATVCVQEYSCKVNICLILCALLTSSDKQSNLGQPGQTIKKFKTFFDSNQIFYTRKISNILEFFIFEGLIYEIKIKKIFIPKSNLRQTIIIIKSNIFFHYRAIIYILN